jgi:monoamine oxidase
LLEVFLLLLPWHARAQPVLKKVIIAGGDFTGLPCGYKVVVLDVSERVGGHVRALHEGLGDGLYVDPEAEQSTNPGYDLY